LKSIYACQQPALAMKRKHFFLDGHFLFAHIDISGILVCSLFRII
jgi:hypothetical protein